MSLEESIEIYNMIKNRNKEGKETQDSCDYKVSGILYINDENWTVWINGAPYSRIGQHKNFSIDSVSAEGVSLTLPNGQTLWLEVQIE
jgi:hypothetical protein